MTLRDCTLFIRSKDRYFGPDTELRLADLDLKDAHVDRVKKWTDMECKLVDQGWYTNTEEDAMLESICTLRKTLTP